MEIGSENESSLRQNNNILNKSEIKKKEIKTPKAVSTENQGPNENINSLKTEINHSEEETTGKKSIVIYKILI